ncbi:MAG TPA: glucose 1-dehydrogenase [Tepidisphaeraceae bacterium]|jgi:NAD(P)-dependent dehydrogenase (short-subunit alcohol dehydrogenase family)|nr:glucose 1-dehydrogenase [Tepidisphaeraceae bacterium]
MSMKNVFDLTGKVAVVIGGTSGLGRAIAMGMAEHGADVVPTGRRAENVAALCGEIEKLGRRTLRMATDVSKRESIDALRDAVVKELGHVDILVNAAGKILKKPTVEISEAEWNDVFETNVTGMLRCCQSFYEPLKKSGAGRVVNIASLTSNVAFFQVAAYGASKGAVKMLSQQLAVEWAKDGITVNNIAPGVFPTELNEKLLKGTERGRELIARTPMGRFGRAEEIVSAAIFLASPASGYVTGITVPVDGGFLGSGVNV